ncbi:hypothetical protein B0J14DRAFT_215733 [Halenospora varia]|nr:hypothetical protein B0J14DRAFT_215733 [Halenospora varia]
MAQYSTPIMFDILLLIRRYNATLAPKLNSSLGADPIDVVPEHYIKYSTTPDIRKQCANLDNDHVGCPGPFEYAIDKLVDKLLRLRRIWPNAEEKYLELLASNVDDMKWKIDDLLKQRRQLTKQHSESECKKALRIKSQAPPPPLPSKVPQTAVLSQLPGQDKLQKRASNTNPQPAPLAAMGRKMQPNPQYKPKPRTPSPPPPPPPREETPKAALPNSRYINTKLQQEEKSRSMVIRTAEEKALEGGRRMASEVRHIGHSCLGSKCTRVGCADEG